VSDHVWFVPQKGKTHMIKETPAAGEGGKAIKRSNSIDDSITISAQAAHSSSLERTEQFALRGEPIDAGAGLWRRAAAKPGEVGVVAPAGGTNSGRMA
jgi:hypothetical protein